MSRIGNTPVDLPSGVEVKVAPSKVSVKGPMGELSFPLFPEIAVAVEDGQVSIARSGSGGTAKASALHGLVRAHIQNMVLGVTEGYSKSLQIVGTGWNVKPKGQGIEMQIGFCHLVECTPPEGVTVECPTQTEILVKGIDKQKVGQFAANIRRVRPPEPYKGKGIRYKGEEVRRKAGKSLG
jgi:large subunit ribosomal protein L6